MDKAKGNRFKVSEFVNPSGETVWRVYGNKAGGQRVRENYRELARARSRATELETEFLGTELPSRPQHTRLSVAQILAAERAFLQLGDDDLLTAVAFYLDAGRPKSGGEIPRLDDAIKQFEAWLDSTPTLRERSKRGLRYGVALLSRYTGNPRLFAFNPELIEAALAKIPVEPVTRNNYRRAWSRFFSWCAGRPRRWVTYNPCREVHVERGERGVPVILNVAQCRKLMAAAESVEGGRMVLWFALCLFGGLRPSEAQRLSWHQVNLHDGEIRLEPTQTKDGRPRIVSICPAMHAWLEAYRELPIYWSGRIFRSVIECAGIGEWTQDVMRHTAATHRLRQLGSYARVSEEFGNSEAVLKRHYASRVSTAETKDFYAIKPKGGAA